MQAAAFGGTQSTGEMGVLMNDGRGSFDTLVHLNQGAQPTDVDAADFTGDGRLDLAVANEQSGTGRSPPSCRARVCARGSTGRRSCCP